MTVPLGKFTKIIIMHLQWVNYVVYKNDSMKLYKKVNALNEKCQKHKSRYYSNPFI